MVSVKAMMLLKFHGSPSIFFRRFSGGLFTAQGGNTEDAPAADAFVLAPEDLERLRDIRERFAQALYRSGSIRRRLYLRWILHLLP